MKEITSYEQFNEVIKSEKPVIVKFGAVWCGPCKTMDATLNELAADGFEYDIYKVDIENVYQPADKFAIMGVPTVLVFANEKVIKKHVGGATAEKIKSLVE